MKNRSLLWIPILFALILNSCGSSTTESQTEDTTPVLVTDASTEVQTETKELPVLQLPEDIDLNGRVLNVWFSPTVSAYNITVYEATGEVVDDALVRQKKAVEETLNCSYTFFIGDETNIKVAYNSYLAADYVYDFLNCAEYAAEKYASQHIFYNFAESDVISIDSPWWNKSYIEEAKLGNDGMYFMLGDMDLGAIRNASALACNLSMLANYDITEDSIYDEVFAGTWTLDRLYEITSSIYQDINGNSAKDEEDVFGIACRSCADIDHWLLDSGVRITERDGDGNPYFVVNCEKTINAIEKIYNLYWENPGMIYEEGIPVSTMFAEKRVAFMKSGISAGEGLRDADIDFTVVPIPKYDESEPEYRSLVHDSVNVNCMLENTPNPEEICAVFEAMAYYGYQYVFPTYYEEALKVKYSHTDNSRAIQMIDLLHDSMTTDFAYIFNTSLERIATDIGRDLIGTEKSKNFTSLYSENANKYQAALEKLIQ